MKLNNNLTLIANDDGTLTVAGTITDGSGGAASISKYGNGELILSGTNSYSGGTTLLQGWTVAGSDTAFGSGTITFGGGTLQTSSARTITNAVALSSVGYIATASNTLTLSGIIGGSGSLVKNGAGTLTLSGPNTYTGGSVIQNGFVVMNSPTALGTISAGNTGTVTIQSLGTLLVGQSGTIGFLTNNGTIAANGGSVTLSISQTSTNTDTIGGLIQDGSGTLSLAVPGGTVTFSNGSNTFSGGITLSNATLSNVGKGTPLGTGTLTIAADSNITAAYGQYPSLPNAVQVNSGATAYFPVWTGYYSITFNGQLTGSGTISAGGGNGSVAFANPNNTFTGTVENGSSGTSLIMNSLADSTNPIMLFGGAVFSMGAGPASPMVFNAARSSFGGIIPERLLITTTPTPPTPSRSTPFLTSRFSATRP
jgi:autotransporter-associated beta strand protein